MSYFSTWMLQVFIQTIPFNYIQTFHDPDLYMDAVFFSIFLHIVLVMDVLLIIPRKLIEKYN
jgi:hypothetical protein